MAAKTNAGEICSVAQPSARSKASRELLQDSAYKILKSRIVSGKYEPGTLLSERQLAGDLQMSSSPVKAALQRLQHDGLVTVSPQRGIVVRELTVQEVIDLFDMRLCLESHAYRCLAGKLSNNQRDSLQANLREQKAQAKLRNVERGLELDAEFHMLFLKFHNNRDMLHEMQRVIEQMFRLLLSAQRTYSERSRNSFLEHSKIATAVIEDRSDDAIRYLDEHLEWGKRSLVTRQ